MSQDDLPTPHDTNDLEFEAFVRRRRSPFPREAELQALEPPAELDRAILSRAREAIHAEPPAAVYRGTRWAVPVALSATVVLAFTIVLNVGLPGRESEQKTQPAGEVTVQNAARTVQPKARELASNAADQPAAAEIDAPLVAAGAPSAPVAPPPTPPTPPAAPAPAQRATTVPSTAKAAPAAADLPAAPPLQTARSAQGALAESGVSDSLLDQRSAKSSDYSANEPNAAADSAPTPLADRVRQQPPTASAATARAAPPATPPLSADDWWARIQRLRANGQGRVADRELVNFSKAYPDDPRLRDPR